MEEVTTDTGFEGRVLACGVETWAKGPAPLAEGAACAKA